MPAERDLGEPGLSPERGEIERFQEVPFHLCAQVPDRGCAPVLLPMRFAEPAFQDEPFDQTVDAVGTAWRIQGVTEVLQLVQATAQASRVAQVPHRRVRQDQASPAQFGHALGVIDDVQLLPRLARAVAHRFARPLGDDAGRQNGPLPAAEGEFTLALQNERNVNTRKNAIDPLRLLRNVADSANPAWMRE